MLCQPHVHLLVRLLQTCLLHGVWMVSLWSSSQNVHHLVCPCEIAVLCGSQ
jgi:hypothetical protein